LNGLTSCDFICSS